MKENKDIILAIFSLQGGGAERFVLTLSEGFKKIGYQPHIICFKKHIDYEIPADTNIHFLNYQGYRWLPKSIRNKVFAKVFDRYVQKNITADTKLLLSNLWQVDQVIQYSMLANRIFIIHNTLSKEKEVHHYLTNTTLQQVYNHKKIVGVSKGVIEDLAKVIQHYQSLNYIHNPIDKESILKLAKCTNSLLSDHRMKNGYLIHVGKFKLQKNHQLLIKAYANTNQKLPLVLVGQGELQAECIELCTQLDITDKVIFAGFHANPYPLIANATGMVLSSSYEGFGIVIGEALALNVPVISTDCESGPRELLPARNLVPVENIPVLSQKIQQLMDNPQGLMSDFDKNLLPEKVAESYLEVVNKPSS